MSRAFWYYGQGLTFSPRVRAIGKRFDPFFNEWRVLCKVTGRNAAHVFHGYRPGDLLTARPGALYAKCRVQRGSFGRLVYSDRLTSDMLDSLPTISES